MKSEISKTQIEIRLRKKKNPLLVGALIKLKKSNPEIAKLLAMPSKKQGAINLGELNERIKDNTNIFFPGKILSSGDLKKKSKIVAWGASKKTIDKIKQFGAEFVPLLEEMKKNPELKNMVILR